MRYLMISFFILILAAVNISGAELKKDKPTICNLEFFDHIQLEIDDDDVIMTSTDEPYDTIVFSHNNELYINGKHIELSKSQRKLVKKYRSEIYDILDAAGELGIAGAEVGVKGTKIGVIAVVNLVKLLDEDYDADDLEKELKVETEKLEEYTDELKEKAEELEEMEEDLKETHEELRESLSELSHLHWF